MVQEEPHSRYPAGQQAPDIQRMDLSTLRCRVCRTVFGGFEAHRAVVEHIIAEHPGMGSRVAFEEVKGKS
jgi:hypothetical protein